MAIRISFPALGLGLALGWLSIVAPGAALAQQAVPGLNNPLTDPGADVRKAEDTRRIHEFEAADTDGDGSLSFAEIEALRRRIFAAMDTNGDGFVTLDEFRPRRVDRGVADWPALFAARDKDGDKRLSVDEFVDAAGTRAADIDGDGTLSIWEYRTRD